MMKVFELMKNLGLLIALVLLTGLVAYAQDGKTDGNAAQPAVRETRADLLRELGLSQDQLRQLRQLNVDRKPRMEEAQRKLREANRLLDEAIYADEVNEADVEARLKDAQQAQADVFRLRSANELAIRRILMPDQLARFRELRKRFETQSRQELQLRRQQNRIKAADPASASPFPGGAKRLRPLLRGTRVPKAQ